MAVRSAMCNVGGNEGRSLAGLGLGRVEAVSRAAVADAAHYLKRL